MTYHIEFTKQAEREFRRFDTELAGTPTVDSNRLPTRVLPSPPPPTRRLNVNKLGLRAR